MEEFENDIIFRLPSELSSAILTGWVYLNELVNLDTAHCNRLKRNVLLESVFDSSQFVLLKMPGNEIMGDFIRWVQLRSVRISALVVTKDVDMTICEAYLRKHGQSIKHIQLDNMDSLEVGSSAATCLIALYCRNVTILVCNKCLISDSIVDVLFYCSALKQLYLQGCEEFWSSNLHMENLKGLQYSHLRTISLQCVDSTWLTERVLMLNCANSLVRLSLRCDEYNIIHRLQQQLAHCPSLRALGLARSRVLSDSFLTALIAQCPHLYHLDLTACMDLTDVSGLAVARSLTQLRTFNMSFCTFSDAVLQELSFLRSDTLQGIYLMSCSNITGSGVNRMLQSCPALRTVGFGGCDLYSPQLDVALLSKATTVLLEKATLEDEILDGLIEHGQQLQHLRLSFEEGYEQFDFARCTAQAMPRLRTLVALNPWEGSSHQSASLDSLRAQRAELCISHDAWELRYDVLEVPV